jgi:hypothetical protein
MLERLELPGQDVLREILIIKRKSNIVLATLQWCSDETGPLSQTSSGFVPNTAKRLSRRASHVGTLIIAHIWGPIRLSEGPLVDGRYGPAGNTKIFDHGPGGEACGIFLCP